MRGLPLILCLAACGLVPEDGPEPFGMTMVEETTCIGAGGRVVMGPEAAYCEENKTGAP